MSGGPTGPEALGRCFVCAARLWAPTTRTLREASGRMRAFLFACGGCGLLADAGLADPPKEAEPVSGRGARSSLADGGQRGGEGVGRLRGVDAPLTETAAAAGWAAHLRARCAGAWFAADEAAPYGLDLFTLRGAALRWGVAARAGSEEQRAGLSRPHAALGAAARLGALVETAPRGVALAVLCRASEADAVLSAVEPHRAWAREALVLVDGPERAPCVVKPAAEGACAVRRGAAPLDGDFAAQRNRAQDWCGAPWVLQLDADETLSLETGARVPALAAFADEGGAVSVGFARRNLVDGVASDLYPDTQYRLNRRDVRFAGRVHERPRRPWQRSLLAGGFRIDHRLDAARVRARSQDYDAMAPGEGRLFEAEALLTPFAAG